jgi:hypothetical protein
MSNLVDVAVFLAALVGLAYGCHQAWPPLGWIVPSAVVLTLIASIKLRGSGPPQS